MRIYYAEFKRRSAAGANTRCGLIIGNDRFLIGRANQSRLDCSETNIMGLRLVVKISLYARIGV
jgi:hypothetical protein